MSIHTPYRLSPKYRRAARIAAAQRAAQRKGARVASLSNVAGAVAPMPR